MMSRREREDLDRYITREEPMAYSDPAWDDVVRERDEAVAELRRLRWSWIKSLVEHAEKTGPGADCDDPGSWWEMVAECRQFAERAEAEAKAPRSLGR